MDFDYLYIRVLKFLNFRPRSEKEVRDYLKRKIQKFPDTDTSIIDVIIHKLKQQRFLNDEEFAKWLVRSRTEYKPKGKRLVEFELKQKGISQKIAEVALNREMPDRELALEVLTHKRKKYEGMEPMERFNKAGSMLARRGFDLDDIKWAIDQLFGKMV